MSDDDDARLCRLAHAVLQPGFEGTRAPGWVLRRLAEGLGSVLLFARNVDAAEPGQLAELTAALRSANPAVIIVAIDEEGGDVTRVEAATGSTTELLREELGFSGLLVTGAMEMRAVADRHGLERAVVMAVAAGADLVCIGHAASDEMVGRLQATLVNAVDDGELAEERLVEAAGRVGEFAAWKGADPTCHAAC